MERFHIIDEGAAILRLKNRVHKQVKIFRRGEFIYAEASGGFVRLTRGGGTDHPYISWLEVEGDNVVIEKDFPRYVEPPTKPQPKTVTGSSQ